MLYQNGSLKWGNPLCPPLTYRCPALPPCSGGSPLVKVLLLGALVAAAAFGYVALQGKKDDKEKGKDSKAAAGKDSKAKK